MANVYWVGNSGSPTNDYSVPGNFTPAAVPVATNSVFVSGAQSITAGLNAGAVTLTDFRVGPLFTGAYLGNSAIDPLIISASGTVELKAAVGNKAYIKAGAGNINILIVQGASIDNEIHIVDGTFGTIHIRCGTVKIYEGVAATIFIDPLNGDSTNVNVEFVGAMDVSEIECQNAGYACSGNGPNISKHTQINSSMAFDYGTVDEVILWGTGSFIHRAATDIASVNAKGNVTFDASQDVRPKTIDEIIKYPNAIIKVASNVTLTNPVKNPTGELVLSYSALDPSASI